MALLTGTTRPASSIPTSSMADIAFLLLVFFLVTTVFPKDDGLALVLPDASVPVSASNVLYLLVGPTGMVEVRQGSDLHGVLVSAKEVGDVWRRAAAANANLIAAVKTGPDVAYQRTVDVLDQLHEAGALRVSLQLLER